MLSNLQYSEQIEADKKLWRQVIFSPNDLTELREEFRGPRGFFDSVHQVPIQLAPVRAPPSPPLSVPPPTFPPPPSLPPLQRPNLFLLQLSFLILILILMMMLHPHQNCR